MTRAARALGGIGVLLVALTGAGLLVHIPGADNVGTMPRTWLFIGIMALAAAAYLASVAVVLRHTPPPGALWFVLGVALVLRAMVLPAYPFLSSDVFRYVWDGRVQNAGINPYRYIPADPALSALRDAVIYPHVGRREYAPTIYPPVAQMVFRAVATVSETPLAMKAAMVGFEALAVGCLVALLRRAGLPPARVLVYAWNPLAVWAFAGNGHVDAVSIGLIALALLARARRRGGWAGALLGAATLVKFLPIVLAPALWRRWNVRFIAALIVAIVLPYALYADVGWRVFGFLPAYGGEEGLSAGTGLWLLAGLGRLVTLPGYAGPAYLGLAAIVLAAIAIRIALWTRWPVDQRADITQVCGACCILAASTVVALCPHYPWYFVWLAAPACVAPFRSVIWLSVAPLLLYLDPWTEKFIWASLVYVPAFVLTWFDLKRGLPFAPLVEKGGGTGRSALPAWIAAPPKRGSQ